MTEYDIFIRLSTTKENHGGIWLRRGYRTIPEKAGYEKVFKPYDPRGMGYYYMPRKATGGTLA